MYFKNYPLYIVKIGGQPMFLLFRIEACPSFVTKQIKGQGKYICKHSGGQGAVRELVEWIAGREGETACS